MGYVFTTKPRPSEPGQENNFSNMQRDGSRYPLSSSEANGFQTVDATASPQVSPLSVTTGTTTIKVPLNAVSVTLCASAATSISENATIATNSFLLPVGVPITLPVANQLVLYATTATTASLSFIFNIV